MMPLDESSFQERKKMSLTPSNMPELRMLAPDFNLLDPVKSEMCSMDDLPLKTGLLVAFISNHCPYVHHIQGELVRLGNDLDGSDVTMVAIGSNDADAYPEDGPKDMAREVKKHGYAFRYLHDATQKVALAYRAACTPDFFLFDSDRRLVYRGQIDGSRPGQSQPVDGADMRAAIHALRSGEPPLAKQMPSVGCNIKWRAGNEPENF